MSQVLYCLAAVAVFALFGLSQQVRDAHGARVLVEREVETAAHGVAQRWAAEVQARAFDEDVVASGAPFRRDADGLTPAADLGPDTGETEPADFDDVDDFHGLAVRDTAWVGAGRDRPLAFDVRVAVDYRGAAGADSLAVSAGPTLTKQATVVVTEAAPGGPLPVRVEVEAPVTAAGQALRAL